MMPTRYDTREQRGKDFEAAARSLTAIQVAYACNRHTPGINWRGCTRRDMLTAYTLGRIPEAVLPDLHAIPRPLSSTMRYTLISVRSANDAGHDAYLETGRCKPFNTNAILALEKRGLIRVVRQDRRNHVFFAQITDKGRQALED